MRPRRATIRCASRSYKDVEQTYTCRVPVYKLVDKTYTVMVPTTEKRTGTRKVCKVVQDDREQDRHRGRRAL